MEKGITWVGLDAHKKTIAVAVLHDNATKPIEWTIEHDAPSLTLLRAGLLTQVRPPTPHEEAMRDLCRCREHARLDLGRARHRLQKMLVRRGIVFSGTSQLWSDRHRRWLREVRFDDAVEQSIFDDYALAIEQIEERLRARLIASSKKPRSYRSIVTSSRSFAAFVRSTHARR